MKFTILLQLLFVQNVFGNENILSKLHQNVYKIKDLRIELLRYSEEYINFVQFKTFKYNRTTPAVNGTFNLKIAVKDQLEAVVQAYKFLSNEYRRFPIRFQVNAKSAFDSNAVGLQNIKKCGNITKMYFEKDVTYHLCNFVIDDTQFPPLMPSGKFRLNLQYTYLNKEVALLYAFGEVYTPIAYPKK